MTQEEKARKYDEALERAKVIYQGSYKPDTAATIAETLQNVFPELAESEDERIRKALLEYFGEQCDMSDWNGVYGYQVVAWLEKQGNQREQLINKACDILVNCIEDYMLRRMEVWSEECKNQTLENIRKKLEE